MKKKKKMYENGNERNKGQDMEKSEKERIKM